VLETQCTVHGSRTYRAALHPTITRRHCSYHPPFIAGVMRHRDVGDLSKVITDERVQSTCEESHSEPRQVALLSGTWTTDPCPS
jgi:hypothetical protein